MLSFRFISTVTTLVNASELKAMAVILDKVEKKFQEVFSTRWLSFEGAVSALLHNFDIMVDWLNYMYLMFE